MNKTMIIAILLFVLTGCSGKVYTIINPDINQPGEGKQKIQGIIAYQYMNVFELYEMRTLINEETGTVKGYAPTKCIPQKKLKLSVKPDYTKPYIIVYEPGLFESNKFSVGLKDGILTSMNAESDPTKGASAIAELLPFFRSPYAPEVAVQKELKQCNAEPKFVGLFRAPEIRSFEDMLKEQ